MDSNGTGTQYTDGTWRDIRKRRTDYRHHCGRLLFKGYLAPGSRVDIRCFKCNTVAIVEPEIITTVHEVDQTTGDEVV